jgi:glycosyltransferase involved in cell wall biosynthesis
MATLSVQVHANKNPFFSVILCTYNRASLLPKALVSLIHQTETDWEAIIVDDGSTDSTFTLAHDYMNKYPHIRYMRHANRGVGASRTIGIHAAVGRYVTFLDSDDEYLPHHLEQRKNLILSHPSVDILHGGVEIIGDPFVADRNNPTQRIHLQDCVLEGTMVVHRERVLQIGGFGSVRYGEGAALIERACEAGFSILKTDIPSYRYNRTTPDSLCTMAFLHAS